jgi:hypothetical protein
MNIRDIKPGVTKDIVIISAGEFAREIYGFVSRAE